MKNRFVVLIDFSEYSADLLRYAYDWSEKTGAGLLLAHQTAVMAPAMADAATRVALTQVTNNEAIARLEQFAREVLPSDAKVDYLASDEPVKRVIGQIREESSDFLILMGLKGTGRLKQIFLGSFVIDVIEHADSIVVAMPRNVTKFLSEKMYVAVHSRNQINTDALDTLLKFTDGQVREMTFFTMTEAKENLPDVEAGLVELTEQYKDRVKTDYTIYQGEKVFDSIRKIINNQTTELLVVQRGSMSLTHQPFRRFIINELVYEGETPLVVLP